METQDSNIQLDDYILGRTSEEYQRLRKQAQRWKIMTETVFERINLQKGMSCLDIGCGPGETMKLMGDAVGPSGQVVGIDIDEKIGFEALEVLRATSNSEFHFIKGDIEIIETIEGQPFDLTYARLVLFHLKDPISVLKKMSDWTKQGGYIVVQEYDFRTWDVYPKLNAFSELERVFYGVANDAGLDTQIGIKIPDYFVQAGIGPPDGTDLDGFFRSLEKHTEMLQAVYDGVLTRAIEFGITTEEKSRIFFKEMNKEPFERYYSYLSPLHLSVWKRKT